ncbi:hypothetical protein EVAR_26398_1 [Eumeta japonica]|uniref:Uncharacterized protein n=1 Tax=Eumeta variegata TaxID=151549 RepID=A0A4C1VSF7_EUMVA|nr:hypothetical protein EVAR_26398_1 [Eumeta japonica]
MCPKFMACEFLMSSDVCAPRSVLRTCAVTRDRAVSHGKGSQFRGTGDLVPAAEFGQLLLRGIGIQVELDPRRRKRKWPPANHVILFEAFTKFDNVSSTSSPYRRHGSQSSSREAFNPASQISLAFGQALWINNGSASEHYCHCAQREFAD